MTPLASIFSVSSASSTPSAQPARTRRRHNPLYGLRTLFTGLMLVLLAGFATAARAVDDLPTLPITVNVNTADARTIANVLQGVGVSRAAAIVAYREQNGSFKVLDDLSNVKGVGNRTLELNATRILLND